MTFRDRFEGRPLAVVAGVALLAAALVALAAVGPATATPVVGPATATPAVGPATEPVDPSVSVPESVNRSDRLEAAVSLPESAAASRSFRVALVAASGHAVATRTVTVDPGGSATADFGTCVPAGSYMLQVASTDGDVLVASQTAVEPPEDPVTIADWDGYGEERVRADGTLRLNATFHGCVDRATFSLADDDTDVWRATVVDADDDGAVLLEWDVDAPTGAGLTVGDGDALANASQPDGPVSLGGYRLRVSGDVRPPTSGLVTVAFATPDVRAFALDRSHSASSAIDAVRTGDAAAGGGHSERAVAADEQWVVVRIDTDGTVDSLPADAALLDPARHENATVRVRGPYEPSTAPDTALDLANATRRFDARTDTVYYALRADATVDTSRVQFVAFDDGDGNASGVPNATDRVTLTVRNAVNFEFEGPPLLAPEESVTVRGHSAFADGTELAVSLRRDGTVLASSDAVVVDDRIRPTVDLSGVSNGTNATLVVERDGQVVTETPVEVAARPVPRLDAVHFADQPVVGEPAIVRALVSNRGTSATTGVVRVTVGNRTRTRNVTLDPGGRRELAVEVDSIPDQSRVNVTASFAGATQSRSYEVATPAIPRTTTTVGPRTTGATWGNTTVATTDAATSWPTLVGSERQSEPAPVPGFGVGAAVAAVLAGAVVVGRRRSRS